MQNQRAANTPLHTYDTENELHARAIDRLVSELRIPAEEVNRSYREILEELKKDVKVKAFLTILVSRGVKERLIQQREQAVFRTSPSGSKSLE